MKDLTSRFYENEHDLQNMQALLMAARLHTGDWRYAHVGELNWDFFMVTCHLNPRSHIRLWHNADGTLVAYAILGEDPTFDCQVLPEFEGIGIEVEALEWAGVLLNELCQSDAKIWGGNLISSARQDNQKRISFLEQHGFHPGENVEVNFLRSLEEPIPEPGVADGFRVCSMTAGISEISKRAAAQREVWTPWTVGNVTDDDYGRFMQLPGYDCELDVVAVAPDGTIAAYVNGWIDPVNWIGDLGPVGALPAYRRQGLTRLVLLECLRRMQARGMDRACVSTGVTNTPAIRLYESIGFRPVNRTIDYWILNTSPALFACTSGK